jgi:hypothetical protein
MKLVEEEVRSRHTGITAEKVHNFPYSNSGIHTRSRVGLFAPDQNNN